MSIDDIENVTGINFLPALEQTDSAQAVQVEQARSTQLWSLPNNWPSTLDQNCS